MGARNYGRTNDKNKQKQYELVPILVGLAYRVDAGVLLAMWYRLDERVTPSIKWRPVLFNIECNCCVNLGVKGELRCA